MAHAEQRAFIAAVAKHFPEYFVDAKVLEVGSLNINGSVRDFFSNCDYLGLDVSAGRDVDLVCEGQKYDGPSDWFDQVISCEAMEHNPHWAKTFSNMVRMCKPGGLVVMTCATVGRREHGTSRTTPESSPLTVELGWDYYRNLRKRDFAAALNLSTVFSHHRFWTNWRSFDLYFTGIKKGAPRANADYWRTFTNTVDLEIRAANRPKTCKVRAALALGGDRCFDFMRKIFNTLNYIIG